MAVIALSLQFDTLTLEKLPIQLAIQQERLIKKNDAELMNVQEKPTNLAPIRSKNFKKKSDGKFKDNFAGTLRTQGTVVKCYRCGKPGYIKKNCMTKFSNKKDNKSQNNKNKGKDHENYNEEVICVVSECLFADGDLTGWWVDSGATRHIAKTKEDMIHMENLSPGMQKVYMGNNSYCDVMGVGTYRLNVDGTSIILTEVLYVPSMRRNLVSVPALTGKCFEVRFVSEKVTVGKHGRTMFDEKYVKEHGMFKLNEMNKSSNSAYIDCAMNVSTNLWHERLGHVSINKMKTLAQQGIIPDINVNDFTKCKACLYGKMTRKPFPSEVIRATDLLEIIHTDICGHFRVQTHSGKLYFITFIDDFSRFGYIYLIKYKSEALEKFKEYKYEVERQLGKNIKVIRSDRGGEYTSNEFLEHCKDLEINSQRTMPRIPQQNGVAERCNRTLLNMVRSMLAGAQLPKVFWGEAVLTAMYTINRVPCKAVPTTP
uniref:Integrase catalytic domain-containing protein n=1 Tax=Nymphaea colorata TaxID=210225 RepID=A0A5K0ZQ04_9MAGN